MKKVGLSDTVLVEIGRKLRVGRVHLRLSPGSFCKEKCKKSRKTLVENVLTSLDIKSWPSEVAMGWDGMGKSGDFGIKNPGI